MTCLAETIRCELGVNTRSNHISQKVAEYLFDHSTKRSTNVYQSIATIQCGLANQMTSTRIVSGSEMLPNEFPWMAFLTVYFWSKDAATCGGTVIGDRWILTAAHCTYGAVNITVKLGAHDVSANSSDANQQAFLAKSFITHPLWRYGDVENDVALIELPQAVVLSGT